MNKILLMVNIFSIDLNYDYLCFDKEIYQLFESLCELKLFNIYSSKVFFVLHVNDMKFSDLIKQ